MASLYVAMGQVDDGKGRMSLRLSIDGTAMNYPITREEARQLGRALICYANLADELDKPDEE